MIKWNLKAGRLVVDPETLTIRAFNNIWINDTSKAKAKGTNMLQYVFHLCDITPENPMRDVPDDQKEQLAKRNAFKNDKYKFTDEEELLIGDACLWYETLNKGSLMRMSMGFDKKIDEITTVLMEATVTEKNYEMHIDSMAKVDKLISSKEKLMKAALSEMEQIKAKGGRSRSLIEKGLIGYNPTKK